MITLVPNANSPYLPVAQVVQRAEAEFTCVVTDRSGAMKLLASRLIAKQANLDQQDADVYLQALANSTEMICTDDRHSDEYFLKCIVVPENPIEIVYNFDGHEEAVAGLLARLARVLNYIPKGSDGAILA